jgi:hypothetical protein
MERITEKQLEALVLQLNQLAGTPTAPYTKGEDGKYTPNAHCYHLSHAYGGVMVQQMCDTGTGVRHVSGLPSGHGTKRELYNALRAYIAGMREAKND